MGNSKRWNKLPDERIEALQHLLFYVVVITGMVVWIYCNTERPLTSVEQYALEESDTKQYDGISLRRVWHPELSAYRWEKVNDAPHS